MSYKPLGTALAGVQRVVINGRRRYLNCDMSGSPCQLLASKSDLGCKQAAARLLLRSLHGHIHPKPATANRWRQAGLHSDAFTIPARLHALTWEDHLDAGDRAFVPLLDPRKHSVPFAVGLELHAASGSQQHPQVPTSWGPAEELYELRYLLAGCGKLVHSDGQCEPLESGDSVVMPYGAGLCMADPRAAPLPRATPSPAPGQESAATDLAGCLNLPAGHPWSLATLVVYFPKSLLEEASAAQLAQQQQAEDGGPAAHAVPLAHAAHPMLLRLLEREWGGERLGSAPAGGRAHSSPRRRRRQGGRPVIKRVLREAPSFQLPNASNRLAVMFDPVATPQVPPLVFGVEVFEGGHRTSPHVHPFAHELFFIVQGEGTAFCEGERLRVGAGDLVVFSPGAVHGLDVDVPPQQARMYCLELMLPNDSFAVEVVRAGTEMGGLEGGVLGLVAPAGCGAAYGA